MPGKTIDLDLVKSADARLKRAKRINPNVTARPVPIGELMERGRVTLTVPELATLTGLHPLTIRRAIGAGELQAANGGGRSHYRISRPDAEAWWRGRGGGTLLGDSAIYTIPNSEEEAETIWRDMTSGEKGRHNAAILALAGASPQVRVVVMQRSAEAAATYYATPEGEEELADWRALDGEAFHDDEGDGDHL